MRKEILTTKQIDRIKKRIDEKLRQRCINVKTTLSVVEKNHSQMFQLTSTPFNTIPVIHSEITINNFGGTIRKKEGKKGTLEFWIPVHAFYAGNGVGLFDISGELLEKKPLYVFFEGSEYGVSVED